MIQSMIVDVPFTSVTWRGGGGGGSQFMQSSDNHFRFAKYWYIITKGSLHATVIWGTGNTLPIGGFTCLNLYEMGMIRKPAQTPSKIQCSMNTGLHRRGGDSCHGPQVLWATEIP